MRYIAYWFPSTFQKDIHILSTDLSTVSFIQHTKFPSKYSIAILSGIAIIPSMQQNFFPTLNAALESEGLLESWELTFPPIPYSGSFSYTFDDGSKHGHYVSLYRDQDGRYERPVHYKR